MDNSKTETWLRKEYINTKRYLIEYRDCLKAIEKDKNSLRRVEIEEIIRGVLMGQLEEEKKKLRITISSCLLQKHDEDTTAGEKLIVFRGLDEDLLCESESFYEFIDSTYKKSVVTIEKAFEEIEKNGLENTLKDYFGDIANIEYPSCQKFEKVLERVVAADIEKLGLSRSSYAFLKDLGVNKAYEISSADLKKAQTDYNIKKTSVDEMIRKINVFVYEALSDDDKKIYLGELMKSNLFSGILRDRYR